MIAQGNLTIKAVDGLKIDIKDINQKSVSQTIDAMVQADPNLAWLKQAEARGDVDWRRVQEIHESFKYSHSGLGAGAQLAIAIVVAYFTAGAASGLAASGASAAGASTAAGSAWAAGVGTSLQGIGWANAAATAALTGAASNTTISTINNRGNLGAVVDDVTTSEALRGYTTAGITAGLTTGLYSGWTGTETGTGNAVQNSVEVLAEGGLSSWSGVGSFAGNQLLQNGTSTLVDRALGGNAQLGDALQTSLANTFAAAGFNFVGDLGDQLHLDDGGLAKIGLHAVMGGLAAEAAGGDFRTGALAAGVNEALVDSLAQQYAGMDPQQKNSLLVMNAQLIGLLAAAVQSNADAESVQTGAWVAQNSTQYNHELHRDNAKSFVDGALDFCKQKPDACSPGAGQVTQQDMIAALEATATHGEGLDKVKPEALQLVNQFLTNPDLADTLKEDLFSPTPSEQERLDTIGTAETAVAVLSLAQAAKVVLMGGGKALSKIAAGLRKESGEAAKGGLPPLRQAYVNEVKALEDVALNMRAAGASPEQVARQLHQMRRDLGIQYKDLTPAPQLEAIYARNLEKYGDKLGPTVDWLRTKGKSWEQIIESASRSGGKDLGF